MDRFDIKREGSVSGEVEAWIDGFAKPNPGHGAIGVTLRGGGGEYSYSAYLGDSATLHQSKLEATVAALEEAQRLGATVTAIVTDSEVVERYVVTDDDVQSPKLAPIIDRLDQLTDGETLPLVTRCAEDELRGNVNDLVREQLEGRPYIAPNMTPLKRLLRKLTEIFSDQRIESVRGNLVYTSSGTVYAAIPWYGYEQGIAYPSIELPQWNEARDNPDVDYVIWWPIGRRDEPFPVNRLGVDVEGKPMQGECPPLVADISDLRLGLPLHQVGSSGAEIYTLFGGPWKPLAQVAINAA